MKKLQLFTIALLSLIIGLTSCSKDDPIIPNEEELITTMTYTLTPTTIGNPVVLSFIDMDGDGGDPPSITTVGALLSNATYTGKLSLSNDLANPAVDISEEVLEEGVDHQFFFQSDVNGLSIMYTDQDNDGNPIGLDTEVTATTAGTGNLTIILRHEPNKTAAGVSSGDITNAGGETDIEVTFAIDVQ